MKITIVSKKNYKELQKLRDNFTVVKDGSIYVAIGGDGTFIRAARMTDKPVLFIRDDADGSIGYHSDLSIRDLDFAIERLKKRDFYVEQISSKIEVMHRGSRYYAINEASLNHIAEEISFSIYYRTRTGRERIYPFVMSGDGALITSALGSTAYNKSAGGPIILAQNVLCITFLDPDGPYRNPIIVDSRKEIEIEVVKYNGILRYDGTKIARLKPGDTFRMRLSPKRINVVKFRGRSESFADKLERKIRARLLK